jgi:ABC-type glycerol-3-phosphate transport system substrate-binding protein
MAHYDGRGTLQIVNADNRTWGAPINLPVGVYNVFPGNDEFPILFTIAANLGSINSETGETVEILNFLNSGVMFELLQNVIMLPDGRVIMSTSTMRDFTDGLVVEFFLLTKTPYSELSERTLLTLAGLWIDEHVRSAVVQFNQTSVTHRVVVTDYSVFNTGIDNNAGLLRLTTEIISGKIPDILVLSGLPFRQYAARGFFEDLNPFLDNDPELNRDDLFDNVLRESEVDGALYRLFPTFRVGTILGNPRILGSDPGWTIDEFRVVLEANPEANEPMGEHMTMEHFLYAALLHNTEQFVDWDSGTVDFDSEAFIELLEFSNIFPLELKPDAYISWSEPEHIASGNQIMTWISLSDLYTYRMLRTFYGGEVVLKGFPSENRTGSVFADFGGGIAITTQSAEKHGAWEFVRLMLTEGFGREYLHRVFPINRSVFKERLANEMDDDAVFQLEFPGRVMLSIPIISEEEAIKIVDHIDSMTGMFEFDEVLWNIINESANDFFRGEITAEDAARVIQSRASIYMAEQR